MTDWEGLAIYSVGDWVNGAITESQVQGGGLEEGVETHQS